MKTAMISTAPTMKGQKEIDFFHPHMLVKNIKNKPVVQFSDGQFLQILKAEKEKYITVTVDAQDSMILENLIGLYSR